MRPSHRKWATRILAASVVATILGIAVAYRFRSSRKEAPPLVPQNLPVDVNQQLSGYTFTRSEQGRQVFTIHAARTLNMQQGNTVVLEDVVVQLFGKKDDRRDLLRTHRAEYDPHSENFKALGTVEIELGARPDGGSKSSVEGPQTLHLETSNLSFRQQGSLVSTDEVVKFRMGPASGSARGMRYATKDAWLELERDIHATFAPSQFPRVSVASGSSGFLRRQDSTGARGRPSLKKSDPSTSAGLIPTQLTASRLRYEKESGEVTLWGPVEITQDNRKLLANAGRVVLNSQNQITGFSVEGDVQAFERLPAPASRTLGTARAVTAQTSLTATASRMTADFDPRTEQIRRLLAEGKVHAEMKRGSGHAGGPSSGALSFGRLDSERVELRFDGVPARPTDGIASGNVDFTVVSSAVPHGSSKAGSFSRTNTPNRPPDSETKSLTTSQLLFSFDSGGHTLKEAHTRDAGELMILAADPDLGQRVITAGRFVMLFDSRNRLEHVSGLNGTRIISQSTKEAKQAKQARRPSNDSDNGPQESSSQTLEAGFDPTTGNLSTLDQIGNFEYTDASRRASAQKARYSSQRQIATLTGNPRIWDQLTRIGADKIVLHLDTNVAEGVGHIQSTHVDGTDPAAPMPSRSGETPAIRSPSGKAVQSAGDSETTNVLADRMYMRRQDQFLHYEGHVRAWHGTDVIESASLDFYGREHRLECPSRVITSHLAPLSTSSVNASAGPSNVAVGRAASGPLTIRAESLEYLDQKREAIFQGNVLLQTGDATLRAGRMKVFFLPGRMQQESQVDHVTADGHVLITMPGRSATGDHADYFAAPGKVILEGGSPTLYDAEKGRTTGRSLTFFIRDDSLLVDGGDKSPAFSQRLVKQ